MTATTIAHTIDTTTVPPIDDTFALPIPAAPAPSRIEVAQSVDDIMDAWRLVYESYRAKGLIASHRFRCHTAPEAIQRGTTVTVKKRGDRTVASISCYRDGRQGLPLDKVYKADLDELRKQGHRLGEIGLFAEHEDEPGCGPRDLFAFMRYPIFALHHQNVDQVVIGVHPRHAAFYRGMLGFVTAGATQRYSVVRNNPVVLLRFDLSKLESSAPAPRGLRYWREHRLEPETFENRFEFTKRKLANTSLPAYLEWLANGQESDTFTLADSKPRPKRAASHALVAACA
ncbi:hypothetical protein ACERK3_04380 [Phycisphaerales bacterium AB-hyl4]|uniref:N-acyl amino acid synthase FeeM catalytic core domain-containing protein n=1 Tax=Natronomicrosphaera hydrolytica TaxID=3242702 RepID=A0ABV4U1P0_9BACT